MRLAFRSLLSFSVGLFLWLVTGFIQGAAKANLLIAFLAALAGLLGFVISYLRHRSKCRKLANDADRIADKAGSNKREWERLLYLSGQSWKQNPTLISLLVGILTWLITSNIPAILGTYDATVMQQINAVLSFVGNLVALRVEETRDSKESQRALAASNEGRWYPSSEDPEPDKSARGKAKAFAGDLPDKLVDAALEGFEDRAKPDG